MLFGIGLTAFLAAATVASALPDLSVTDSAVSLSVRSPTQGASVTLNVTVRNIGDASATNVAVSFYLDSQATQIGTTTLSSIAAGGSAVASVTWSVGSTSAGAHTLIVVADPAGSITETSEANNGGQKAFDVNQPPTAGINVNATAHLTHETFTFDAATSNDPDGSIVSYLWVFDDGAVASGYAVSHAYTDGGQSPGKTYVVTLVVVDDDGGTRSDQQSVLVTNRAPTANALTVVGLTKTPLVFDGTSSTDSDGRIVNATWSFSDGVTRYGLTVLRSFDDNGAFTADLTVRDEDGATDTHQISITVNNQAPRPIITTSPPMPFQAGQTVTFDSSNSYDVDGGIANTTWFFPGGQRDYGQTGSTSFPANGTYNVTLLLIDDDGAFAQLTVVAIVGEQTGGGPTTRTPPVAAFTASATTVLTGEVVTFDASTSTDDIGIVSYEWEFGDSSTGSGLATTHSWASDGIYVVSLNVTDTDGESTVGSLVIRVVNRLPVALPVAAPASAPSNTPIAFDGTSSSDPDGNILFWRWDFGDGQTAYGAAITHAYTRPGVYTARLTVTDNDGGESAATVVVTATNMAPLAVVGPDFTVETFESATFSAMGSSDPDGTIVSYSWDFGDGATGSGVTARHAYTSQGTRTVTLTVRDDAGVTAQATLQVTVVNTAPTIDLAGPATLLTAQSGRFEGNAVDRDGSISTWRWQWGDGTADSTTANSANHSFTAIGVYTVRLTVTDNSGASSTQTLEVRAINRLPTAVISAPTPPVSILSLEQITFGSVGSTDAESPGSLTLYWIFGDGGVATGASPTHTFASAGTYTVILTVVDAHSGASSATLTVVVRNRGPTAVANAAEPSVTTGVPLQFTGTGSTDQDGRIVTYQWEFGDGSTSLEANPTYTYAQSPVGGGAYTVRLTVIDNLGSRASTTIPVTVLNQLPLAVMSHPDRVYASVAAVFRGNASTDPDGLVLNWTWDFGDGTIGYGQEVGHAFPTPNNYTVKLTVRDNSGGQTEVVETVVVQSRPVYDDGNPGEAPVVGVGSPGFEGAFALAAFGAVAGFALVASRQRRRL